MHASNNPLNISEPSTLPGTDSSHPKVDGWNMLEEDRFLPIFSGELLMFHRWLQATTLWPSIFPLLSGGGDPTPQLTPLNPVKVVVKKKPYKNPHDAQKSPMHATSWTLNRQKWYVKHCQSSPVYPPLNSKSSENKPFLPSIILVV